MITPLLEVAGASVHFGGLRALDDVSISVHRGTIVGLIGPNGAGKTTLFNTISGIQALKAGRITFDGADITGCAANGRAALGIARSFQNLGLMSDETVLTNVAAAQHVDVRYRDFDVLLRPWRWRIEERRVLAHAREVLDTAGLAQCGHRRVSDLSFGVARFAEIACVLARDPRLLLLDEPTTGLDSRETAELTTILRARRDEGATVLVVAHDVRFVMSLCEDVYVLAEGRNLAHGAPADIRNDPAVVTAYLGRAA